MVRYKVLNSFSVVFLSLFLFVSSVKSVLVRMASTAISKYGPNILIVHGTTKVSTQKKNTGLFGNFSFFIFFYFAPSP